MIPKSKRSKTEEINQVAFFDVDNTLLKGNASRMYFNYFYKHKKVTLWKMFRMAIWSILHRLDKLKEEKAFEEAVNYIVGWDIDETKKVCKEAFENVIGKKLSHMMKEQIEDHRKLGHKLVLVTSMPEMLCEQFKDYFKMDDMLCSRMEVIDNKYTGVLLHMNYRHRKIPHMHQWAEIHDIDMDCSYFYADSITDAEAMEQVGHPIAVNPDNKLKAYAQENGWKIIMP